MTDKANMGINRTSTLAWLHTAADTFAANRDYLTELDAAIGDADHGTNMDRGFKKVLSQLSTAEGKDTAAILKATGMALISSVGGAAGPLYGTLFLRAASAAEGKDELLAEDAVELLRSMLAGVIERGKAAPGNKTMVDALAPAVSAFESAVRRGASLQDGLQQMVEAAQQGMLDTIPLQATKGRASYLGERSIGHQDPGATSCYLLLRDLAESVVKAG